MLENHGNQNLSYVGTIIDIETIGEYRRGNDSRVYADHKLVIFGYINKQGWHIYCAESIGDIPKLIEKARQLLIALEKERPLYAFNCHHEMGVFFHHLNMKIIIDQELQSEEYESKGNALQKLGILESYNDPFQTARKPGMECMIAWKNHYFDKAIQHNRACLLKEQALLLQGRGIKPIPLTFTTATDSSTGFNESFTPWTKEQENYIKEAWNDGNALKAIAQNCGRTPNAIWIRLQRLKEIPADIPYTVEKISYTMSDLSPICD